MNPVALDLGMIEIKWYSLFIFLAVFVGGMVAIKEGKKHSIASEIVTNLIFWGMIFALLGARLYYVAFNFDVYQNSILDIFKVWEGGLAIHGGIFAFAIFMFFYCRKYAIKFFLMSDISVVGLIIGQSIGRWGNFFNGEAHGPIIELAKLKSYMIPNFIIEGMNIGGVYYHPTFFYESVLCLVGFILLVLIRKYRYLKIGTLTSLYLMYYSVIRYFIEQLRTDSLYLNDLKVAQLVSIGLFGLGLIGLIISVRGSHFEKKYHTQKAGIKSVAKEGNEVSGVQF